MPDLETKQPATTEESPESKGGPQGEQGSESTTTGTSEQGGTEKSQPGAGETGSESEAAVEELNLENIEKTEEGYTLKVGSSVYKGKTINETVNNALKGIAEKDTFISQLRADKVTRVPDKYSDPKNLKGQPGEATSAPELPVEGTVYQEEIRRAMREFAGLDPKMLSWTEDQWDEYASQDGMREFRVSERRQQVREVLKAAAKATQTRMDEASTVVINADVIQTETKKVKALLENSGLSEKALDEFDYEAILDRAMQKRGKSGVLESGAIVHEAALEIQKMLKDEHKSPAARKLEEDILKGKKVVAQVPVSRGGAGGSHEKAKELKPTGDWEKAGDRAIADYLAGKK